LFASFSTILTLWIETKDAIKDTILCFAIFCVPQNLPKDKTTVRLMIKKSTIDGKNSKMNGKIFNGKKVDNF
jgi:hypothetical protein